jgi:hypothetical protein
MADVEKIQMSTKAVPRITRDTIVACASRRGQTQGEWLAVAVTNQARIEEGDALIPAGRDTGAREAPPVDLVELRDTMQTAVAVSQASGVPLPKQTARHAFALLNTRMRSSRGLPALQPRKSRTPVIDDVQLPLLQAAE